MRPPIFVVDPIARSQDRINAYCSGDEVQMSLETLDVEDGDLLFYDADGAVLMAKVDSKNDTWRLIVPADTRKDPDALKGFLIEYLVACEKPPPSLQDLDLGALVELAAPLHLIDIRLESHYQDGSAAIGGKFQANASSTRLSAKIHFVDRKDQSWSVRHSRYTGLFGLFGPPKEVCPVQDAERELRRHIEQFLAQQVPGWAGPTSDARQGSEEGGEPP